MQDFPRLLPSSAAVGFTTVTGTGLSPDATAGLIQSGLYNQAAIDEHLSSQITFYTPVKNNVKDAAAKQRSGMVPGW